MKAVVVHRCCMCRRPIDIMDMDWCADCRDVADAMRRSKPSRYEPSHAPLRTADPHWIHREQYDGERVRDDA